jgi:hypothetical protein
MRPFVVFAPLPVRQSSTVVRWPHVPVRSTSSRRWRSRRPPHPRGWRRASAAVETAPRDASSSEADAANATQPSPPPLNESVVVTATRGTADRDTSPASSSVVTCDQIERRAITSVDVPRDTFSTGKAVTTAAFVQDQVTLHDRLGVTFGARYGCRRTYDAMSQVASGLTPVDFRSRAPGRSRGRPRSSFAWRPRQSCAPASERRSAIPRSSTCIGTCASPPASCCSATPMWSRSGSRVGRSECGRISAVRCRSTSRTTRTDTH